jgi:dethiobiotin synthetase
VIAVTGTGTEVGKTWVACELITELRRRGASVAARKPAQSYGADESRLDADRLAEASGETAADVCPVHRCYAIPMAPPMAADALGLARFSVADLARETADRWPRNGVDVGVVEGAGGVASPQADDGDMVDLVTALQPDQTVLVADAGLGTINAVRLSLRALAAWPVVVYFNRWDPGNDLHVRNRDWLAARDEAAVAVDIGQLVARLPGLGGLAGLDR